MKTVAVDFETFYSRDCNVQDLGIYHYVNHPEFEAYLVSIYDGASAWVGHPKDYNWDLIAGETWVSHNVSFDGFVFAHLQDKKIVSALIRTKAWHCTANLSSYICNHRDLASASKVLLKVTMSKELRNFMKGRKYSDLDEIKKKELLEYNKRDAICCWQIWDQYNSFWPKKEKQLSLLTTIQGWKGVQIDVNQLGRDIVTCEKIRFEASLKIPWAENDKKALSPLALAEQCRSANIPVPKSLAEDSMECAVWEEQYGKQYPWVAAMRDLRKSNLILTRLNTIKNRLRGDDCITFGLKYFGAHTGRWSGDSKLNLQNLPRGDYYGANLRKLIIPRAEKKFVICDLAQIEPRILAWLIDDLDMLEKIRGGMSIYEAHARSTMGWKGGELKKEDPKTYALAKARILALGYGCGHAKFALTAKTMLGLDLSEEESKKLVSDFRLSNPKIKGLWNFLQTKLAQSANNDFDLELPSGRSLHYKQVKAEHGNRYTADVGGIRKDYYGGMLCENLVQATARDVFSENMLELFKDKRIKILFSVHDEVVCEVDKDFDSKTIEAVMSRCPDWLEGCPIAAEAFETMNYAK